MKSLKEMGLKVKIRQSLVAAGEFARDNKLFVMKLTMMGLAAAGASVPDVGFCNAAGDIQVTPLQKPMEMFTDLMTGPIPICFTVVSGAVGGLAWGMGWEQQVTQRALKCVGGGAVATSVGQGMSWIGLDNVTGCLFM